jgi:hypothetical protein
VLDTALLSRDLSVCENEKWKDHFNTRDYSGDWNSIALYSATGGQNDILTESASGFKPTKLLAGSPYFSEVLDGFKFEKESVRLLRLAPGSIIHEHRDLKLAYEHGIFRLHIPLRTSEDIDFIVGGERIEMKAGECWYANFDLPHSVRNDSGQERIHLVIDGKRNLWTDELFRSAGYDFEAEEKQKRSQYDAHTIGQMIEGLKNMKTETAMKMVADLLEQKKQLEEEGKEVAEISKDFIPSELSLTGNEILFRWTYSGKKRFTEPFFHETLVACNKFYENKDQHFSTVEDFFSLAEEADSINPSAFIFHTSRCGSTLLSQLLATDEKYIVLSEVPLLDAILRLPYDNSHKYEEEFSDRLFKAAIRLFARRVRGNETHLFIKCDSWHTMFYERIRRCFPGIPFFFLYRSPAEVMHSQKKEAGMQALPGAIELGIFGFENKITQLPGENYFALVLERYLQAYLDILAKDANAFLLNYHDGIERITKTFLERCSIPTGDKLPEAMLQRSLFHSKNFRKIFSEEKLPEQNDKLLENANRLFQKLEKLAAINA